ncbi:hypothetical protein IQ243_10840 [Nostocales cyanobacterium LEGE 11386]|nr:hypothetical protein [Nostocales cyanobacterium LEGE 11386]
MTTEVAILNKEAIALAADSAVTVSTSNGTKIYNSANKLFALSKFHPVGIMVYGNAELSGVPWETLIKIYRKKLKDSSFPTLKEYCNDFINFLTNHINFFSEKEQFLSLISIVSDIFQQLREEIRFSVAKAFEENTELSDLEINHISEEIIDRFYEHLDKLELFSSLSKSFVNSITRKYKKNFEDLITKILEDLSISNNSKTKLNKIALYALIKNHFSSHASGIVIAGFGEEEIFPTLHTYDMECVFENKLKYFENKNKSHNSNSYPAIIPFAQEDMISTFITGIDPRLESLSLRALEQILQSYFEKIIDSAKQSTPENQPEFINSITRQLDDTKRFLLAKHKEKMIEYKETIHIAPILSTVNILPKDELGAMAEALVNLTSRKRRVTTDAETVGGPTDVAIISKGDGFIWIKRKHYFDPELNYDFFRRRFDVVEETKS